MERLIQYLWRYGYFWCGDCGKNVLQTDLSKLDVKDAAVIEAVAAWQNADANFSILARTVHGREIIADGDVGPVTEAMLAVPRCAMPDVAPPPGKVFDLGNTDINAAVKRWQENQSEATGSGSWPVPGCDLSHPTRETVHSIRIGLDISRCPSTIKSYLNPALAEVSKSYAEVGLAVRYLLHNGPVPDCEIDKKFQPLSGNVIGWNEFPSPNTCRQTINGRLDTGYAPSDWRLWANLECHETGHGVGLQHGRGSIMNPSILLVWPMTFVGTYSYPNLKRWFGGEPIPGPGPVPPTPTHPKLTGELFAEQFPGGIAIRGEVVLEDKYTYIIVPDSVPGRYKPSPKPVV